MWPPGDRPARSRPALRRGGAGAEGGEVPEFRFCGGGQKGSQFSVFGVVIAHVAFGNRQIDAARFGEEACGLDPRDDLFETGGTHALRHMQDDAKGRWIEGGMCCHTTVGARDGRCIGAGMWGKEGKGLRCETGHSGGARGALIFGGRKRAEIDHGPGRSRRREAATGWCVSEGDDTDQDGGDHRTGDPEPDPKAFAVVILCRFRDGRGHGWQGFGRPGRIGRLHRACQPFQRRGRRQFHRRRGFFGRRDSGFLCDTCGPWRGLARVFALVPRGGDPVIDIAGARLANLGRSPPLSRLSATCRHAPNPIQPDDGYRVADDYYRGKPVGNAQFRRAGRPIPVASNPPSAARHWPVM